MQPKRPNKACLLAPLFALTAAGCSHVVVVDRLDTFVASSFADAPHIRPQCMPRANHIRAYWRAGSRCRLRAGSTRPGDPIELYLLAVNSRDLLTPHGGKRVAFNAVDRDGVQIPEGVVSISPAWVMTNAEGRNAQPVTIRADVPGDYRIRLTYPDRGIEATGFSPVLHVSSGGGRGT